MAASRPRRGLPAIASLVALAALSAGAWGLKLWAPFADQPDTPADVTWPHTIEPLARFVEDTTGLTFLQPVPVEWVADSAAIAARTADDGPSAEHRANAAAQDQAGRALGLWAGDVSSIANDEAIYSGESFAYWMNDTNILLIAANADAAQLTPQLRAEIVFELTLAIDEQHFHLIRRSGEAHTRQEYLAGVALFLGDASWVHAQFYEHGLTESERSVYDAAWDDAGAAYDARVAGVPLAYLALRQLPQSIGPTFVGLLRAQGNEVFFAAMSDDTPVALDQVSLPVGKYGHRDPTEHVSAPSGPARATVLYSSQAGPFMLFLMLSTGQAANAALTAADGWGNDAYTIYGQGDQVCIDLHVVADSRHDADLLDAAFTAWAQARPPAAGALVGRDGSNVYASACDPGPAAEQRVPVQDEIDQFVSRDQLILREFAATGDPVVAECVGTRLFADFSLGELFAAEVDITAEITSAEHDCTSLV